MSGRSWGMNPILSHLHPCFTFTLSFFSPKAVNNNNQVPNKRSESLHRHAIHNIMKYFHLNHGSLSLIKCVFSSIESGCEKNFHRIWLREKSSTVSLTCYSSSTSQILMLSLLCLVVVVMSVYESCSAFDDIS